MFPLVFVLLLLGAPVRAQPRELQLDWKTDGIVTGSAATIWVTAELLQPAFGPTTCRWCDRSPSGVDTLNPVDRSVRDALRWSKPQAADVLSGVAAFGLVPVGVIGMDLLAAHHDGATRPVLEDALLITEATALAGAVNEFAKYSAGRERPFVHVLPEAEKALTPRPSDNNTSFYSGHTNFAFALAVSAGTLATLRGYTWAPWVWAVGMPLATFSGYLRIAADKHYFTDVVVGAAAGSAIGFAVPALFHRPVGGGSFAVSVAPDGASLSWSGQW